MTQLAFKPYNAAADRDFLYAAHRETSKITFGAPFDDAHVARELARPFDVRDGAYLDGVLVGVCDLCRRSAEPYGAYGNVSFLYIAPPYRNLGLGGQLIQHAADWCRSQGLPYLMLRTGRSNLAAQCCYEKNGFVRLPARDSADEYGYVLTLAPTR